MSVDMQNKDIHKYEDILTRAHPVSKKHPQMPRRDRAAQFAPFAALTGHKEAVHESQRLTDHKKILDENKKVALDYALQTMLAVDKHPKIKVIYFEEDPIKEGGKYVTLIEQVKRINEIARIVVFMNGTIVEIDDIYEIAIEMDNEF